jgi:hypothetical protein
MVRIYTRGVSTSVIRDHAFWQFSKSLLEEPAMGAIASATSGQTPIAIIIEGKIPVPASSFRINGIQLFRIRRVAGVVTLQKREWAPLDPSKGVISSRRNMCEIAASASATYGRIRRQWGKLGGSYLATRNAQSIKAKSSRVRTAQLPERLSRQYLITPWAMLAGKLGGHLSVLSLGVMPRVVPATPGHSLFPQLSHEINQIAMIGGVACIA